MSCGVASSLLYVAMNILAAMRYPGYDSVSQTVSELSAIGAPTRPLWVGFGILYSVLVIAFGGGVVVSAGNNRRRRAVGGLFITYASLGFVWPPMHQRGVPPSATDTGHIACAMIAVLLMLAILGIGATAFGKGFRIYSFVTLGTLILFGTLTSLDAPQVAMNVPTPLIGVWERINIGVFLLWVVVLATMLLRTPRTQSGGE